MIDTLIVAPVEKLIDCIVTEFIIFVLLLIIFIIRMVNIMVLIFGFTCLSRMIDHDILALFAFLV